MKSRQKAWRNHRTKYSVSRVHRHLIFCCIANEALCISEGDIARCRPVTLVIGNDLHSVMLPHANATVSRSQIDSDSRSFTLPGHDSDSSENNTRGPLLQKTTQTKDYTITATQSAMSETKQKTSRAQIQRGKAKARHRTSYKDAAESERREFLNDGALLVSRAPASCLTRDVNRGQFRWVLHLAF